MVPEYVPGHGLLAGRTVLVTAAAPQAASTDSVLRSLDPALGQGPSSPTVSSLASVPGAFPAPAASAIQSPMAPAFMPPPSPPRVQRSAEPVAMPLAPVPVQREPAAPSGPATGQIQRVEPESSNAQSSVNAQSSNDAQDKKLDYDRLAEEVWPRIRRKLRVERERERGLPY